MVDVLVAIVTLCALAFPWVYFKLHWSEIPDMFPIGGPNPTGYVPKRALLALQGASTVMVIVMAFLFGLFDPVDSSQKRFPEFVLVWMAVQAAIWPWYGVDAVLNGRWSRRIQVIFVLAFATLPLAFYLFRQ